MNKFLAKNQVYLILAAVVILSIIIFISFFSFSSTEDGSETSTPIPSVDESTLPVGSGQPAEGRSYQYATPEDEKGMYEDALVGRFISELPYLGSYMRIDYSYRENSFTVRMDPDNIEKAEAELDELLKSKGIRERIKLYNLRIFKD